MRTLRTGDPNIGAYIVAVGCTADVSDEPRFQKEIYFEDIMYSTLQKK
jgi:hypothetical protein